MPEIATVSMFGPDGGLTTAARDEARLASLLGGELEGARARLMLPPESEVAAVWPTGGGSGEEVVSAHGLRLLRGEAEVRAALPMRPFLPASPPVLCLLVTVPLPSRVVCWEESETRGKTRFSQCTGPRAAAAFLRTSV